MNFRAKKMQKGIASFIILNMVLPLIFLLIFSVPVFANGLTEDDAYKGLLVALVIIIVAKIAKVFSSSDDSANNDQYSNNLPFGYTDEDLAQLARVIHAESRGEPYQGQIAVGAVVLNRVKSHQFPNSVRAVIYAPGQFTSVADGQINLTPNESAYRAARAALDGQDPTFGALYFYNPKTARNLDWFRTLNITIEIGNHVFAK